MQGRKGQSSRYGVAALLLLLVGVLVGSSAHDHSHHVHDHPSGPDHKEGVVCGHSKVAAQQKQQLRAFQDYQVSRASKPQRQRTLQATQPATIRITVFDQLSTDLSASALEAARATVDVAVRVIQKYIQIRKPKQGKLYVRPQLTKCETATIPANLSAASGASGAGQANSDYLLFITSDVEHAACQEGVIAFTLTCDYDVDSGRPTLGTVNLCQGAFGGNLTAWQASVASSSSTRVASDTLESKGKGATLESKGKGKKRLLEQQGARDGRGDEAEEVRGEAGWTAGDVEAAAWQADVEEEVGAGGEVTAGCGMATRRARDQARQAHRRLLQQASADQVSSPRLQPPPALPWPRGPPESAPPSPSQKATARRAMQAATSNPSPRPVYPPPAPPPSPPGTASQPATALGSQVLDALVHELVHGLGFHGSLFSKYIDPNTDEPYLSDILVNATAPPSTSSSSSGRDITYLCTPTVQQQARVIMGCETLVGAQLENEGSAAQAIHHWEFRFYYQDLMTPLQLRGLRTRVTGLTLGALQDTGWYEPRWSYVQPLDGRLPKGCDLPLADCGDYQTREPGQHYCAASSATNKPCLSATTPSTCGNVNTFTDGCRVLRPSVPCPDADLALSTYADLPSTTPSTGYAYFGFGGLYGPDSRCQPWASTANVRRGGCFSTACTSTTGPVQVSPTDTDAEAVACPVNTTISAPAGPTGAKITCPTSAATMCQSVQPCTCVNGECLASGRCACTMEYMGLKCSVHVSDVKDFDDPDGK